MLQPSECRSDTLVIFDCDGVLIDSEPLAVSTTARVLRQYGLPVDDEFVYANMLGKSVDNSMQMLSEWFGICFRPDFKECLDKALFEAFSSSLKPMSDVCETLQSVRGRKCVASSSQPSRVDYSLNITNLRRFFGDDVFSGSLVPRGKPAPDLFLYACAKMGVPPARCIVVEDSLPGIEAARAAGMSVLAFAGGGHIQPAKLDIAMKSLCPDGTVRSMHELTDRLAIWETQQHSPSVNAAPFPLLHAL